MALQTLSGDQCVLLAASLASEGEVEQLGYLSAQRPDALTHELSLQIILHYLPEACEPSRYTHLVSATPGGTAQNANSTIQIPTEIASLSNKQAKARRNHLTLPLLDHPTSPSSETAVTRFLICRSHRLADAGLLQLVPQLLEPFLATHDFVRTWFIGNVLPLLRYSYEYYPEEDLQPSLETVERASGQRAVEVWLAQKRSSSDDDLVGSALARDLRSLVGPWMYGSSQRKRRRLDGTRPRRGSVATAAGLEFRRRSLSGSHLPDASHEWEYAFTWLAHKAASDLSVVAEAFDEWDGPNDIDTGGFAVDADLVEDMQTLMDIRYVQSAFSAVYSAESASTQTVNSAHNMLVRIADLMNFEPPPDLATSVEMLPRINAESKVLSAFSEVILDPEVLLKSGHPLTNPTTETYALLQMFVYSAYILAELGHSLPIIKTALLKFQGTLDEQNIYLQKLLHAATSRGKKDEQQLLGIRSRLLWLWGWGIPDQSNDGHFGSGILGKIDRKTLERHILKIFLAEQSYELIIRVYIERSDPNMSIGLSLKEVEACVVSVVLSCYDNASNGNRTRGSLKRATDTIRHLRKHFPYSLAVKRIEALLAATHALSFYTLILQYGVPFQPVAIRVMAEPISLIEKVLAQNDNAYTHLDDLISIGKNLAAAGLLSPQAKDFLSEEFSLQDAEDEKRRVERQVIGMAIEAALYADDFETAYSYVVNRLHTNLAPRNPIDDPRRDVDDVSWRAALLAGRHKSGSAALAGSISAGTPRVLRRLEQRMELLSQALLLAPQSSMLEVLSVWRKCEEEMSALIARESAEEQEFDDAADQRRQLPGSFVSSAPVVQPRREIGRGGNEEEPMGLFDVARGAASAFSRTAFPLRGAARNSNSHQQQQHGASGIVIGGNRAESALSGRMSNAGSESSAAGGTGQTAQRKRDMIAGAASGALASGLGWVLGATPVQQQQQQQQHR